jgi:multidrug efflux pump subunit AcrA (membrane-fusion protein)
MVRKYILPAVALLGVGLCAMTVATEHRPDAPVHAVADPAQAPFVHYVAGAGIVEAQSENIQVGNVVAGVVHEVLVKVGDRVRKGQPLWLIDDRELQSDLLAKRAAVAVEEAQVAAARARYARLKEMPRPEEIPPAEARADADLHAFEDARDQLKLAESVTDRRAVSQDDLDRRRHAVEIAEARLAESRANLSLLKAGAWEQDVKVAESEVVSAQARMEAAKAQSQQDVQLIERLTVAAPVDGQILQVKVHVGEYAPASVADTPLMLIGDVRKLVVRADVDENDAWRVPREATEGLHAVAFLRGNRDVRCDLEFSRIEPFVIPKKSLTGDTTERVDTRVLQVLYTFDAGKAPIYVGQQMDVFIETR